MDDDAILKVVTRLSRRHQSGGQVIERAAILAEGGDCAAILAWIAAHDGEPETLAPTVTGRGLHSARRYGGAGGAAQAPRRYVLPAAALAPADPPA